MQQETIARRGGSGAAGAAGPLLVRRPRRAHEGTELSRFDVALARGLGWFSIGLGVAELAAPGPLARAIGVRERPLLFRLLGLREVASGVGIFTRRRPASALWSRVVGDAIDLGLLGLGLRAARRGRRDRLLLATKAVAGVTALDVVCAARHTRGLPRLRTCQAVRTVAINRAPGDCYAAWRDLSRLPGFMAHVRSVEVLDERRSRWEVRGPAGRSLRWEAELVRDDPGAAIGWRSLPGGDVKSEGLVEFLSRPAGKGTLVRVSLEYRPPAGRLGAAVAGLLGESPRAQLQEDLRRFKQLLEAGEVPTTEGQPAGRRSVGHRAAARLFTGGGAA